MAVGPVTIFGQGRGSHTMQARIVVVGVVVAAFVMQGCASLGINKLSDVVLTCNDFQNVQPGMTFAEVVDVAGGTYELSASSAGAAIYDWRSGRGSMSVTFIADEQGRIGDYAVVSVKAQYGLC